MFTVQRGSIAAMVAAVGMLLALVPGDRATAVVCVADCNGDGVVLINELVGAVTIALGSDLSLCPSADANGDGQVVINEVINAVSAALYGCGVTPTPTASPSPSPSPTYGVDVSGHWRSDQSRIPSSTCVKALTDALRESIRAGNFNCDYTVVQRGPMADVTETCQGERILFTAEVAPDGTLSHREEGSDSTDGCLFTVTSQVVAPLAQSPTTITGTYDIDFEPGCGIADCRIVVTGRLRRIQ